MRMKAPPSQKPDVSGPRPSRSKSARFSGVIAVRRLGWSVSQTSDGIGWSWRFCRPAGRARLDAQSAQLVGGPDARQQQQVRRVVGAAADDHLALGAHGLEARCGAGPRRRPPARARRATRVARASVSTSRFPRPTAGCRYAIGRAAAPASALRELKPARAFVDRTVVIVVGRDPGVHSRFEGCRHQRVHRAAVAHGQRPADAVVVALAALVVLRAAEVRQQILVAPVRQAHAAQSS